MTAPALVAPLRAFGRDDLERAGGKGANLGELVRIGMPVPDGFVVTTAAYAAVDVATRDRASYESAGMPQPLAAAIADAYAALGAGPVAVRSSATAEDLPGAAFAGQQDTYLNVVGQAELIDAVRRCWGSLWTERAIAYRDRLGIDPADVRIAVVVQRMVDADAAGVLFTADPVTGSRDELVVESSAGLGEAVVSGLVTPDHYVLDARARVRAFVPGRHEVVVRAAAGGGVAHESGAVAGDAGDAASIPPSSGAGQLPEAVLTELVRLGREVADHFGRPQDIEWATAAGRVWLLQARPMTALPPPPIRERLNPLRRRLAAVLLELLPSRPYPMDMSTWVPHGPAGLMAKVTASIGLRGAFEDFLREKDGVVYELVPPRPHPTPRIVRAPFLIASRARRFDPARWEGDPRYRRYRERVRELAARDVTRLEWRELLAMPRDALALVEPVADLRIDYLPGAGVALARLFFALTLSRSRLALGDLLLDGRSRTERANRDLERLAARVRDDPDLARRFAVDDPADLVAEMERMPEFVALLAEHGHRESASPLLATSPTWGEAPEIVVGLIKVLATAPAEGRSPRVRPPIDRLSPRVQRRIEAARAAAAFREDSHYEFTRPLPILRAALLEIGRRLAAVGVLDRADDVWHLRLEEIEELEGFEAVEAVEALEGFEAVEAVEALEGFEAVEGFEEFGRLGALEEFGRLGARGEPGALEGLGALRPLGGLGARAGDGGDALRRLGGLGARTGDGGEVLGGGPAAGAQTDDGGEALGGRPAAGAGSAGGAGSTGDAGSAGEGARHPAPPSAHLRERVRARSARRDELAGVRLIDPRAVFPQRDAGDAVVSGEPASGGRVTGRVRIVREPAEFGRLEPGEILVCPSTNPSWTPLFQRAAAVVVDSGGIASHAAIVAREYGIPAIMGTADGTATLHDGELVTVDGDTGRVTVDAAGR